ncbi:MAG: hypothetical protein MJ220_00470 [Bacilli bacterium]|nr:hypothetical protein [Bacilli bacterium]
MLILKAIGSFFVKIWRWIKDTAWVQPILIVGGIFALIFSIPYISEWVSSAAGKSEGTFYNKYSLSLEGEVILSGNDEAQSEADKFTVALADNQAKIGAGATTTADLDMSYGTKFFLVYIKEDCSNCNTAESGFKYLRDKWSKYNYAPTNEKEEFKMYTISASEESTTDEDYENVDGTSAFNRYIINHMNLFNTVGPALMDAPYYQRAGLSESNYDSFSLQSSGADSTSVIAAFPVPTILLVDYSEEAFAAGRAGISEVLFSVSGDTDAERATMLKNMWNHCDPYEKDPNNLFADNKTIA